MAGRMVSPPTGHSETAKGLGRILENAMAFQPAPNIAMVEIRGSLKGQNVENTLYFEHTGSIDQTALETLLSLVDEWMVEEYIPVLPSDFTLRELYARSLSSQIAPEATNTDSTGTPGGAGSAGMPNQVTWAVSFRSGLTGRSSRGRNFIMGIPASQVDGNEIDEAFGASIVAAYEQLLAVFDAGAWTWVILSRQQNGVLLPNALGYAVAAVSYTDFILDTQRGRLPKQS